MNLISLAEAAKKLNKSRQALQKQASRTVPPLYIVNQGGRHYVDEDSSAWAAYVREQQIKRVGNSTFEPKTTTKKKTTDVDNLADPVESEIIKEFRLMIRAMLATISEFYDPDDEDKEEIKSRFVELYRHYGGRF